MSKLRLIAIAILAIALACTTQAKEDESVDPSLPKILLIGDSISGGYQKQVKRALKDKAVVVKNEGNAEWTGTGLKKIDSYLAVMKKHDVEINDLYSFILPDIEKYSPAPDNVHFTGSGCGALASKVAATLEAAISELNK